MTMAELLEAMFTVGSAPRLYTGNQNRPVQVARVTVRVSTSSHSRVGGSDHQKSEPSSLQKGEYLNSNNWVLHTCFTIAIIS
jgi:hypothetical protein